MCNGKAHFRFPGPKDFPTEQEWKRQIDLVERLLLVSHSPSLNKTGVEYLTEKIDKAVMDLHVLNWGDYGVLIEFFRGSGLTPSARGVGYQIHNAKNFLRNKQEFSEAKPCFRVRVSVK